MMANEFVCVCVCTYKIHTRTDIEQSCMCLRELKFVGRIAMGARPGRGGQVLIIVQSRCNIIILCGCLHSRK